MAGLIARRAAGLIAAGALAGTAVLAGTAPAFAADAKSAPNNTHQTVSTTNTVAAHRELRNSTPPSPSQGSQSSGPVGNLTGGGGLGDVLGNLLKTVLGLVNGLVGGLLGSLGGLGGLGG
jgi:hypothetical protein